MKVAALTGAALVEALPEVARLRIEVFLRAWPYLYDGDLAYEEQYLRPYAESARAIAAFCSVIRPEDHPARPADYRPLDGFWRARGYAPLEGVVADFRWKDLDREEETAKPLQFWMRRL